MLICAYNILMKTTYAKMRNPFQLQGSLTKPDLFEGWYYKQVQLEKNKTFSFIFGISTGHQDPHSFIQVIQSNPLTTVYLRFPLSAFHVDGDTFILDKNRFSFTELELHINQEELKIDGIIHFTDHKVLPQSFLMPTIMGPFAYLPNLECNHGVISMHHHVNGTLIINHESYYFKNEIGYLEKDWGHSFPKRYIWIQGNHFENPKISFMASIATIPFLGFAFEGVICHLDLGVKQIRLATYNGTRKTFLRKTEDGFAFELKKGAITLTVSAHIQTLGVLKSPHLGHMTQTIKEGIGGTIELCLQVKGQSDIKMSSAYCGIEIEGY